jgi:hypothetical protein
MTIIPSLRYSTTPGRLITDSLINDYFGPAARPSEHAYGPAPHHPSVPPLSPRLRCAVPPPLAPGWRDQCVQVDAP